MGIEKSHGDQSIKGKGDSSPKRRLWRQRGRGTEWLERSLRRQERTWQREGSVEPEISSDQSPEDMDGPL